MCDIDDIPSKSKIADVLIVLSLFSVLIVWPVQSAFRAKIDGKSRRTTVAEFVRIKCCFHTKTIKSTLP